MSMHQPHPSLLIIFFADDMYDILQIDHYHGASRLIDLRSE